MGSTGNGCSVNILCSCGDRMSEAGMVNHPLFAFRSPFPRRAIRAGSEKTVYSFRDEMLDRHTGGSWTAPFFIIGFFSSCSFFGSVELTRS